MNYKPEEVIIFEEPEYNSPQEAENESLKNNAENILAFIKEEGTLTKEAKGNQIDCSRNLCNNNLKIQTFKCKSKFLIV